MIRYSTEAKENYPLVTHGAEGFRVLLSGYKEGKVTRLPCKFCTISYHTRITVRGFVILICKKYKDFDFQILTVMNLMLE